MTILFLLSVASNFAMGFANGNRIDKARGNPYPLIDYSRNFIEQKHYLGTLQPLREELIDIARRAKEKNTSISLYLEFLNTGANISINPDDRIIPASLIKLPVAMMAMKKIQDGKWKMDNLLVLMPGDADEKSGNLHQQQVGSTFSIELLLRQLLEESDNTAYNILVRNLDKAEIKEVFEHLGLDDFFGTEGKINAKEYTRLFRSLYGATYLDSEHSQKLLEYMARGPFQEFLSGGIPKEVTFSHKYGINILENIYSDSGIVYLPNRPYMLTVMLQPIGKGLEGEQLEEAKMIMKEISEKSYAYLSNYKKE